MQIEVSIHTHSSKRSSVIQTVSAIVADSLRHHCDRLTRAELHLRDMNGERGSKDQRCTLEVRPAGMKPVAVSHEAASANAAIKGALEKMNRQLSSTFGKRERMEQLSASGLPS